MIISTSNHQPDFRVDVHLPAPSPSGCQMVFLELGPEHNGVRVLLSVEQLREVQYLIDTTLAGYDRKPAPVIESIPMFIGDAGA